MTDIHHICKKCKKETVIVGGSDTSCFIKGELCFDCHYKELGKKENKK